ncbi:MAG: glutathione S-transferase family protein [Alphaproteobacteria bacterium]|nr:glutathione S-transferase family protein [Alphaproteobacteria bacterium]
MSLVLHYHPLSSFSQKVATALYENGAPFEARIVDLMDPAARAEYLKLSPMGKIPILQDGERAIVETSVQIEYLDRRYPGRHPLLPADPEARLEARLWDRLFDLYVEVPMQKIVSDRLRPVGEHDPRGVADARAGLKSAYTMIDAHMAGRTWAAGDGFSIADCAAAPGLLFAGVIEPFDAHAHLAAYFERLLARPSYRRALAEAQPFLQYFPFYDAMPVRFRDWERG